MERVWQGGREIQVCGQVAEVCSPCSCGVSEKVRCLQVCRPSVDLMLCLCTGAKYNAARTSQLR